MNLCNLCAGGVGGRVDATVVANVSVIVRGAKLEAV